MADERVRRVQERRRSNAAGPHRPTVFDGAEERRRAIVEWLADESEREDEEEDR